MGKETLFIKLKNKWFEDENAKILERLLSWLINKFGLNGDLEIVIGQDGNDFVEYKKTIRIIKKL